MSVPPAGRRPSSTPTSKGRPDDDDDKKANSFKLPTKDESVEGQDKEGKKKGLFDLAQDKSGGVEEKKKKGLFDIPSDKVGVQEKQQNIPDQMTAEAAKGAKEVQATEAAAQVRQVGQLVQRMVESMRVGQIDGKDLASMDLKKEPAVPPAFQGANLTISYADNGITIHFDNFMTPQQQNQAINLVEKNKEQLQAMVQQLNTKNIQVVEMTIGTHSVNIPRVEAPPPPFETPPATQAETEQQRDRGEQRQQQGGQGGPT